MNRSTLTTAGVSVLLTAAALTGCASTSTTAAGTTPAAASSGAATAGAMGSSVAPGAVLPVSSDPIVNTATAPTLQITYAAVEDNVEATTKKAITDRLEVTVKNTGTTPQTGFEMYYTMTDVTTKATENYYQKLGGLTIPAGQEQTIYFDNETGPGHYPENTFSIYRSSTHQVDFTLEVSATGAKIATGTATKSVGTGEKSD